MVEDVFIIWAFNLLGAVGCDQGDLVRSLGYHRSSACNHRAHPSTSETGSGDSGAGVHAGGGDGGNGSHSFGFLWCGKGGGQNKSPQRRTMNSADRKAGAAFVNEKRRFSKEKTKQIYLTSDRRTHLSISEKDEMECHLSYC